MPVRREFYSCFIGTNPAGYFKRIEPKFRRDEPELAYDPVSFTVDMACDGEAVKAVCQIDYFVHRKVCRPYQQLFVEAEDLVNLIYHDLHAEGVLVILPGLQAFINDSLHFGGVLDVPEKGEDMDLLGGVNLHPRNNDYPFF